MDGKLEKPSVTYATYQGPRQIRKYMKQQSVLETVNPLDREDESSDSSTSTQTGPGHETENEKILLLSSANKDVFVKEHLPEGPLEDSGCCKINHNAERHLIDSPKLPNTAASKDVLTKNDLEGPDRNSPHLYSLTHSDSAVGQSDSESYISCVSVPETKSSLVCSPLCPRSSSSTFAYGSDFQKVVTTTGTTAKKNSSLMSDETLVQREEHTELENPAISACSYNKSGGSYTTKQEGTDVPTPNKSVRRKVFQMPESKCSDKQTVDNSLKQAASQTSAIPLQRHVMTDTLLVNEGSRLSAQDSLKTLGIREIGQEAETTSVGEPTTSSHVKVLEDKMESLPKNQTEATKLSCGPQSKMATSHHISLSQKDPASVENISGSASIDCLENKIAPELNLELDRNHISKPLADSENAKQAKVLSDARTFILAGENSDLNALSPTSVSEIDLVNNMDDFMLKEEGGSSVLIESGDADITIIASQFPKCQDVSRCHKDVTNHVETEERKSLSACLHLKHSSTNLESKEVLPCGEKHQVPLDAEDSDQEDLRFKSENLSKDYSSISSQGSNKADLRLSNSKANMQAIENSDSFPLEIINDSIVNFLSNAEVDCQNSISIESDSRGRKAKTLSETSVPQVELGEIFQEKLSSTLDIVNRQAKSDLSELTSLEVEQEKSLQRMGPREIKAKYSNVGFIQDCQSEISPASKCQGVQELEVETLGYIPTFLKCDTSGTVPSVDMSCQSSDFCERNRAFSLTEVAELNLTNNSPKFQETVSPKENSSFLGSDTSLEKNAFESEDSSFLNTSLLGLEKETTPPRKRENIHFLSGDNDRLSYISNAEEINSLNLPNKFGSVKLTASVSHTGIPLTSFPKPSNTCLEFATSLPTGAKVTPFQEHFGNHPENLSPDFPTAAHFGSHRVAENEAVTETPVSVNSSSQQCSEASTEQLETRRATHDQFLDVKSNLHKRVETLIGEIFNSVKQELKSKPAVGTCQEYIASGSIMNPGTMKEDVPEKFPSKTTLTGIELTECLEEDGIENMLDVKGEEKASVLSTDGEKSLFDSDRMNVSCLLEVRARELVNEIISSAQEKLTSEVFEAPKKTWDSDFQASTSKIMNTDGIKPHDIVREYLVSEQVVNQSKCKISETKGLGRLFSVSNLASDTEPIKGREIVLYQNFPFSENGAGQSDSTNLKESNTVLLPEDMVYKSLANKVKTPVFINENCKNKMEIECEEKTGIEDAGTFVLNFQWPASVNDDLHVPGTSKGSFSDSLVCISEKSLPGHSSKNTPLAISEAGKIHKKDTDANLGKIGFISSMLEMGKDNKKDAELNIKKYETAPLMSEVEETHKNDAELNIAKMESTINIFKIGELSQTETEKHIEKTQRLPVTLGAEKACKIRDIERDIGKVEVIPVMSEVKNAFQKDEKNTGNIVVVPVSLKMGNSYQEHAEGEINKTEVPSVVSEMESVYQNDTEIRETENSETIPITLEMEDIYQVGTEGDAEKDDVISVTLDEANTCQNYAEGITGQMERSMLEMENMYQKELKGIVQKTEIISNVSESEKAHNNATSVSLEDEEACQKEAEEIRGEIVYMSPMTEMERTYLEDSDRIARKQELYPKVVTFDKICGSALKMPIIQRLEDMPSLFEKEETSQEFFEEIVGEIENEEPTKIKKGLITHDSRLASYFKGCESPSFCKDYESYPDLAKPDFQPENTTEKSLERMSPIEADNKLRSLDCVGEQEESNLSYIPQDEQENSSFTILYEEPLQEEETYISAEVRRTHSLIFPDTSTSSMHVLACERSESRTDLIHHFESDAKLGETFDSNSAETFLSVEAKRYKIYPLSLSPIYEDDSSQEDVLSNEISPGHHGSTKSRENATQPSSVLSLLQSVSERLKMNFDEDGQQEVGEGEDYEDEDEDQEESTHTGSLRARRRELFSYKQSNSSIIFYPEEDQERTEISKNLYVTSSEPTTSDLQIGLWPEKASFLQKSDLTSKLHSSLKSVYHQYLQASKVHSSEKGAHFGGNFQEPVSKHFHVQDSSDRLSLFTEVSHFYYKLAMFCFKAEYYLKIY